MMGRREAKSIKYEKIKERGRGGMTSDLVWVAERKTTEFLKFLVKLHPKKNSIPIHLYQGLHNEGGGCLNFLRK